MNARILRKWSIHTKKLMSCSVCSVVVVVLLLLVTCAPSLILATMNFRSDASFASNLPHKPKNVIKEATLSSSSLSLSQAPSSSSTSAFLTSLSPSTSLSLASSILNRNHRLASSSRMEAGKTADTKRESFLDYYKNYHTDDTNPMPPPQRQVVYSSSSSSSSGSSSSSSGGRDRELLSANSSKSREKILESKQQLHSNTENLAYLRPLRAWPRHHSISTAHIPAAVGDASFNDDIKQSYATRAVGAHDEYDAEKGDVAERNSLFVTNENGLPKTPAHSIISYSNRIFPVQPHTSTSNRRRDDRGANHVAPYSLPLYDLTKTSDTAKTDLRLQRTSRTASAFASPSAASTATSTSAHLKQPELIHSNNINNLRNVKSILSTAHTKSVVQVPVPLSVPVPVPLPREGNAFGIDNSNLNKIKLSGLPLRFIIESYEVPASLPLTGELTEHQRRMLIHEQHLRQLRTMQQQAARSRRDSLRGRYKKNQSDLLTASSSSLPSSLSTSISSSSSSSTTYSLSIPTSLRKSPSQHNLRQHQHQHQHQHQVQHQHQHQHQPHVRKHSRRYCSARDPAQLAFEAPTVFEGKIVSMTPDRRQNFSATVEVREVFKQQIGYRLQKYLRLQFAYRNSSGECDIYREELRPRGLVRGDTIEPGRFYLLFVQQIDIGNFTILGQPIRKTKRVVEAVRYAVSGNYAQLASIKSISASNRSVENGQELRIICKVTGRPPPKVTWFKDHRSINRNRKLYQFSHYKKRSELIIRSFNTSDAGRYECRAKNKVNRNIERRAIVIKAYPVQRFDPNPRGTGNNCPDDASEFCFNGGTCKFFSEIGSYSCICPEGFIGERCDRKEVNNMPPSTYSNEHECGENKYLGSYYC